MTRVFGMGRTRDRGPRGRGGWGRFLAGTAAASALAACGTQSAPITPGATTEPGSAPPTPPAEIVESGANCLVDAVVDGLTGMPPQDTGNPGPAPGVVPPGFEPVEVVACRTPLIDSLTEPSAHELVPRLDDPDPEAIVEVPEPGDDHLRRLTVEEVSLGGDLTPLLDALARESEPPTDGACMAMYEVKPVIFLVDAAGRPVRPQWPVNECGCLHAGAAETLAQLTERDTTVHHVDQCIGPCSTEDDD